MIRYFRNSPSEHDFSPEEHEWLASAGPDEFIFVLKSSDRWTRPGNMSGMIEVPTADVPVDVRRKAGHRLGAHRKNPWKGME